MANLKLRKKYYTGLQIIDAVKDLHLSYDDSLKLYKNLSSISTDDVAPVVHGEWRPGKEISRTMLGDETLAIEYDAFYCSSCGRRYKEYVLIYNYCPRCGAKMDGGDLDAKG